MAIDSISLKEFDSFDPARGPMIGVFIHEKGWVADSNRNIIGTLTLDKTDKDWGYAILARHEDGRYRWVEGKVSIESRDDAEAELVSTMERMEQTDQAEESLFKAAEPAESEPGGSILVTDINTELKRYLNKHPEKLYDLSPRKFEELIASILEDLGFEVELTQATRDGGSDIIAYIRNAVCEYLTLVECKKYAPENKVGVGIIRQVTGVHHIKRATKSIIVTTSFFSPDAINEAKAFENQLDLKDYEAIKNWLKKY
ncbi:MAG: restriction endonuclease [Pseudomonadota bacterium]